MPIDRNILILSAIVVGLAAGFVVGLWLPHRRTTAAKQQQIRQRQDALAAVNAKAETRSSPQSDRSRAAMSPEKLKLAIPARPDLGLLLSQIGQDLNAVSVTEQQLQAKTIVDGSDFSRVPMTLRFRGSFEALFDFLHRLESRQRVIRIDRVMVRRDGVGNAKMLQVDIDLSTFFRASVGNPS